MVCILNHGGDHFRHWISGICFPAAGGIDEEVIIRIGFDLLHDKGKLLLCIRVKADGRAGEGQEQFRIGKHLTQHIPGEQTAAGIAVEGAVFAGGDKAFFINGFRVGMIGAFHQWHNVLPQFLVPKLHNFPVLLAVIIEIGWEHINQRFCRCQCSQRICPVRDPFLPFIL